jgi:hypothetical protein
MRTPENETLLNVFRKRRAVSVHALGELLEVSGQTVSRYCLPSTHKNHRRPNRAAAEALRVWSGGAVTIANYADAWTPEIDATWLAAGLYTPSTPAEAAP